MANKLHTMRFNHCLIAFVMLAHAASAQTEAKEKSLAYLTPKDSVYIILYEGQKYILHPVKPKQTLFSLCKYYAIGLEELYENNPAFRTDPVLRIGAKVTIPIPNKAIIRYKNDKWVPGHNAALYYSVQPGDNLYSICKKNFAMPLDTIVKRNKLKSQSLKTGQILHLGWINTDGIRPDWRGEREPPNDNTLIQRYESEKTNYREAESQGVCFWQRDSQEKGDMYALHREALLGTVIKVYNPMTRRTVHAKVIGRIPEGYERNVEIILSPEAARQVGARDPKFFVKLKFLKS